MRNKPTRNQQPHRQQNRPNRQPVPSCPPKREQETHPQNNTSDFTRDDIETREDQKRADYGRAQIAGWQGDGADAALHVCYASFVGVEGDGFDSAAGTAGGYGVAEFVECDDQHLLFSLAFFIWVFDFFFFFFEGIP